MGFRQNISYARSLLTKLEQEALAVKIHVRRQELQSDLVHKREILEQLVERMADLAEEAARKHLQEEDDHDTSDAEDDILAEIIATPSTSEQSLDSTSASGVGETDGEVEGEGEKDEEEEEVATPAVVEADKAEQEREEKPISEKPPVAAAAETTNTVRSRRGGGGGGGTESQEYNEKEEEPTIGQTTGASSTLFGDRGGSTATALTTTNTNNNNNHGNTTATTEAILDHQRVEQEAISESILKLAGALKAQSQAFSHALEEDRETVERAGQGMDKTGEGMNKVSGRMDTLTKLTSGEGYLGRMLLYGQVYGLMAGLVTYYFKIYAAAIVIFVVVLGLHFLKEMAGAFGGVKRRVLGL